MWPPDLAVGVCSVEGCDRSAKGLRCARGFCPMHYQRWRKHGDPIKVAVPRGSDSGPLSPNWRGENVSYFAVHYRLRQRLGRAADHRCEHCEDPAAEWAYDHDDPSEKTDRKTGMAYSLDADRYMPLCRSCHKVFDNAARSAVA